MGQVYISVFIYMFDTSVICHVFICFQMTKYEINRKDVVYFHCRLFYNGMGLIPKFRNGKRSRSKLEKQNIRLKPEMTD